MLISFKSIARQNENENVIEFSSQVEFENENDFFSYRFDEPSNKIANLIEIKKDGTLVRIFAGQTSLELELNKDIEIIYKIDKSQIFLLTHMNKIEIKSENDINFKYFLKDFSKNLIGEFEIFLKII
ncbi:DUF1934 domain-containing protein [[Mycoplasma] mobile]|uniref:Uncharacterized protein n=1 Tax=Mycoplasma mobile (strain ATCC 43663 / 163K / NCTC 11711) TaxID=267748 RepID=Q6KIT4_MYCM1|nr:DUF1934 domain-containing protein [[Mycoplasma] mobile]AAT27490.1 conserved hypothetical protein [Mycoplasma mobile 163K]